MWKLINRYPLGFLGALIALLFALIGIYAPFFASSKPLFIFFDGELYFPLFRYLFYQGFYTKPLDIFFNILMFTLPFFFLARKRPWALFALCLLQGALFYLALFHGVRDPANDSHLAKERQKLIQEKLAQNQSGTSFQEDLLFMNSYAKLNQVVKYVLAKKEHRMIQYDPLMEQWLKEEAQKISWMGMPLVTPFHWEEDARGSQKENQFLPWYELTRINRKSLAAALIFGIRISLVVGFLAVGLALLIGVPIGAFAGYFGGTFDIIVSRLLEIWESMPTFFMLLLVISILQSKSIFIVIAVIGIFGWTSFARYIRGEFFKQRHLSYVEACHLIGFSKIRIIFSHILPNALAPLLTLLPFAIMGAITSEAGLSFLGLGEEGSCSWGVLMDEGRSAFPAEAYLLWPPAILLTTLLVSIALIGDALRDALDPKLHY